MISIGIDLHKHNASVCALDTATGELKEAAFSGKDLFSEVSTWISDSFNLCTVRIVYEAGLGYGLARHLKELGLNCQVTQSNTLAHRNPRRKKTDRIDAEELARLLSVGLTRPVYIPSEEEEALKALAHERNKLSQTKADIQRRILSLLLRNNALDNLASPTWSNCFIDSLKKVRLKHKFENALLKTLVSEWESIAASAKRLDNLIEDVITDDSRMSKLKKLRGFANLSSFTVVAEAMDFKRFKSPQEFASYHALTPCAHNSGKKRQRRSKHCAFSNSKNSFYMASKTVLRDPFFEAPNSGDKAIDNANRAIRLEAQEISSMPRSYTVKTSILSRYIAEEVWRLMQD